MADNIKEQERDELHRTIWKIANELRGSVDGWDFKQYVLGMLFYRYISENLASYIDNIQHEAGDNDFAYADMADSEAEYGREEMVWVKGFFILPSELFCNVLKKHLQTRILMKHWNVFSVILKNQHRVLRVKMILKVCLRILM